MRESRGCGWLLLPAPTFHVCLGYLPAISFRWTSRLDESVRVSVWLRLRAHLWLGHATTRSGGLLYFRKGCVLNQFLSKSIESNSNQALGHESDCRHCAFTAELNRSRSTFVCYTVYTIELPILYSHR